jgi:hypothetical protein
VWERPDGLKARCAGTGLCADCRRDAGEQVQIGDVVLRRVAPQVIVESAPPRSRVSLEVVQKADDRLLFISGDRMYLGNDPTGAEVVYRVTGWDASACALLIERERP